jgi:hypothetical protein|tara:strand:- start:276 stop:512 length:237 start_codon:yes stop_codon:yes gene_type:complete
MVISAKLNKNKFVPNTDFWINFGFIMVTVLLLRFIFNTFGITFLFSFIPEGLRLLGFVAIAIYLKSIFTIKFLGREVL